MAKLIIVDDEKNIRQSLSTFFKSLGHEVRTAESGPEALKMLGEAPADLVLTDYRMAEMNGLELLKSVKQHRPGSLVILMTAYANVEDAVAAMKAGAYDYVTKPFSLEQIQHLIERALQLQGLQVENRALRDVMDEAPLLDSRSPAMTRLLETAQQAAASDATILLTGESGTGKNVLARQIHRWSPRREHQFVVVNCTTLSDQLLESELFGHVRGSFTGAVKDKPGRVEAADRGTVFSMKSLISPVPCRQSFCASYRSRVSNASAVNERFVSMHELSRRQTVISRPRSPPSVSAMICIIV
jgi:DNA-binding NtrC family response regulator